MVHAVEGNLFPTRSTSSERCSPRFSHNDNLILIAGSFGEIECRTKVLHNQLVFFGVVIGDRAETFNSLQLRSQFESRACAVNFYPGWSQRSSADKLKGGIHYLQEWQSIQSGTSLNMSFLPTSPRFSLLNSSNITSMRLRTSLALKCPGKQS